MRKTSGKAVYSRWLGGGRVDICPQLRPTRLYQAVGNRLLIHPVLYINQQPLPQGNLPQPPLFEH